MPVATLLLLGRLDDPSRGADAYRIDHAEYTLSRSDVPPQDAHWQEVDVPASFAVEMAPFVSVWYRVPVTIPPAQANEPWALYMTSPDANVAAYLNRLAIGTEGPAALPLVFVTAPLLYPFDPRLLQAEEPNYLYVRITRKASTGGIAPFYIGPVQALRPYFSKEWLFSEQAPAALMVLMGMAALLTLALFVLHYEEKAYGWYALAIGLWALHTGHGLVNHIPLPHFLWFSLVYLTLWWVPVFAVFTNRFFELPWRLVEPVLWSVGGVLTVIGIAVGISGSESLYRAYFNPVWIPFVVLSAVVVLAQLVYASIRKPDVESLGMLLTATISLVVGVRDAAVDVDYGGGRYFTQYTAAFSVLMVILLLARRFVRYQRESASINRRLAEERARITRDMHDGLGGQLIHALSLSQRSGNEGELRAALATALQDLRLIIDSLTPSAPDVVGVLAGFRHRTAGLLREHGIEMTWRVEEAEAHPLPAEHALHLLRILQEVVTNVVRHADASSIDVRVCSVAGGQVIEVADDGVGIGAATPGNGLRNMHERAALIGSTLEIDTSDSGTRVRITLRRRDHMPHPGA